MNTIQQQKEKNHHLEIIAGLCNGCVLCMKACPTKAIRVRDGRLAEVTGVCVDCGECIRVCPRGAIRFINPGETSNSKGAKFSVVAASTVLYSQFGEDATPNDILLGLKRMGFSYVHDESYTNEMFNVAIELYIEENKKKQYAPWPLISPVCPVVTKLIACRFPELLEHIPPLAPPREIVAMEVKKRLAAKHGCDESEIRTVHIAPCPAKMISIKEPFFQERSHIDGAEGISDIYGKLLKSIEQVEDDQVLHHSGGVGLGWGMTGGEISGLHFNCLAVSGLKDTIEYLEKIEMGWFPNVDYMEFRICNGGCVGGLFTVADNYQARHLVRHLVRMYGVEKRVKYSYVKKFYQKGWFFTDKVNYVREKVLSNVDLSTRIQRQKRVEEVQQRLPGKECGMCGSPDCSTFAEDVADKKAILEKCIFHREKNNGGKA